METLTNAQAYPSNAGTTVGGYSPGFAKAFGNYQLVGNQLVTTQEISHQFEWLWTKIVNAVPAENSILLSNIKTKLDEAYMFTGKAIARPIVCQHSGAMSY